jgi:hypothetical protein
MTSTFVGNVSQGSVPTSMKDWRVHKFGPPEAMFLERFPSQILVHARCLSKFTQQSVPGKVGSEPARARCRSFFHLRSVLICQEQWPNALRM